MTSPLPGPAFIAQMPPSPETSRRWWTMYCRECGIEEMMSATPDEPRLIEHRDAHNREVHGPSPLPTDEDAREAALMQDRVDWYVDHEAEPGIATNAFVRGYDAGFRRSVVSTPEVQALIDTLRKQADGMQNNTHTAEQAMLRAASALEASAVSAPPTITDEMVERAAIEYHERGNGEGSFDRVSDHVRSSLRFRMRAALRAALNPKGDS